MKERYIALVDADNFFASCEQLVNPNLLNKPVCVLSNNDGCVIARSKEAKKMGIKMGMPYFMAKKEFPSCEYVSSNFALYHDISNRLRDIFRRYSEFVDIYSIDEAFLDLTGMDKVLSLSSYKEVILKIRNEVKEEVGISVSVGLANSKTLAKIATHKAKQGLGVYWIKKDNLKPELKNFPIEEIWGIGKGSAKFFRAHGIFYASQIVEQDESFLRKNLGVKGLELKLELLGENYIGISNSAPKPKSVQRTRAFSNFTTDKELIKSELYMHLHNACKCLRKDNLKAKAIGVMLRTKDFQVSFRQEALTEASSSELYLIKYAENLFEQIFIPEIKYRATGIYLGELQDDLMLQQAFFEDKKKEKSEKIAHTLDIIEEKFGRNTLSVGFIGQKRTNRTQELN